MGKKKSPHDTHDDHLTVEDVLYNVGNTLKDADKQLNSILKQEK